MALWRYIAVNGPKTGASPGSMKSHSGELAAESAAAVRASLRRIGLQALSVKPVGQRRITAKIPDFLAAFMEALQRHLRGRRRMQRAEIYDSLATMLASG